MFYNQRNNELYPTNSCGISAYLNAMVAAGYPQDEMEALAVHYNQLEDEIAAFFHENDYIRSEFRAWESQCDNPWEVHYLLNWGIRQFFRTTFPNIDECLIYNDKGGLLSDLETWLSMGNTAVCSSQVYSRGGTQPLNHIICVAGYSDKYYRIIDSWGNLADGYSTKNVGDCKVSYQLVRQVLKPLGKEKKLVHFIKKYGGSNV